MPELPEVETIRLQLDKFTVGKEIINITTDSEKQVKPNLHTMKNKSNPTSTLSRKISLALRLPKSLAAPSSSSSTSPTKIILPFTLSSLAVYFLEILAIPKIIGPMLLFFSKMATNFALPIPENLAGSSY